MTMRPEPYLRFWNSATFAAIDRLTEVATDYGVSTAGMALGWLAHHPDVTSSIVGPRRPGHFEAVEEAIQVELKPDEWAAVGALFTTEGG